MRLKLIIANFNIDISYYKVVCTKLFLSHQYTERINPISMASIDEEFNAVEQMYANFSCTVSYMQPTTPAFRKQTSWACFSCVGGGKPD